MKRLRSPLIFALWACFASTGEGVHAADVVFQETGGLVAVEAEHFSEQTQTETRQFYATSSKTVPAVSPDGDPPHVGGASGGAYLEILPDTRRTHGDKLIHGTNFSPTPGKMAVLHYKVNFKTAGKYYVWVRAFSTGPEDNGLHVGLDGEWPESGQRLQWCQGKKSWRWDSNQRTDKNHCGEPHKIFLEIKEPGDHTIAFSMREDGFEFDKWFMTTDREFVRPEGVGPKTLVASGELPAALPYVEPPAQLAAEDAAAAGHAAPAAHTAPVADASADQAGLLMPASSYVLKSTGYYLDQGKWAAIHPDKNKTAKASKTFPFPTGKYNVTLRAIGESDGECTYIVSSDNDVIGDFKCPLSKLTFEDAPKYRKTWNDVSLTEGTIISVQSSIASADGQEYSRARWHAVEFTPADAATKKAAKPYLAKQKREGVGKQVAAPKGSPTTPVSSLPLISPRKPNGDGSVTVTGEAKVWHKVTLTMNGPYAHEQDNSPNPFLDYAMSVKFQHSDGTAYTVPGFFAADGDASNSSAESGTAWRANFAPDRSGNWTYSVEFKAGKLAAVNSDAPAVSVTPFDGQTGSIAVAASDKTGRDFRAQGRLQYVGQNYLQHATSKQFFLKAGADAPETLLGYVDFDGTVGMKTKKVPLKKYLPHVGDWKSGDPTWQDGKGKGLIGAINYLSGKGCNAFSFLTYNAGGDGDNVWPFIQRNDKLHYDCSKLDQWDIVFDHGTDRGMYLHFKLQETENDDRVPESLDGGNLGTQRKLYYREMIARYGHNLALNWNLGEENTQSTKVLKASLDFLAKHDAYGNNRVLHTFPGEQDKQYLPLIGDKSELTGLSLQNSGIHDTHGQTVKWVSKSREAGKPWVVAFDESGTAAHGQCPDLGYKGYDGHDGEGKMTYTEHEVRQQTLWGTLMAGGAGVEYYFGYRYAENDLVCEDWRSRDRSWDYCRIAIEFFADHKMPIQRMTSQNGLIGNSSNDNSKYCFAENDSVYLVYLADGGSSKLDLSGAKGDFSVSWFNPRSGGDLQSGSVTTVQGGGSVSLGNAPADSDEDWLVVVKKN